MISIRINNDYLDLYSTEVIQWNWKTFRFSNGITDAYTNDFNIPKTTNNLRLLNVYSVLDSENQRVKKTTVPAILQEGNRIIQIYIEVNEITSNEISIAVFENSFFGNFKDKLLNEYFVDDSSTIIEWISNSPAEYAQWITPYNYGTTYNYSRAQYHSSKSINSILQTIGTQESINIEQISDSYKLLASKKNVCPQNTIQAIELDIRWMTNNYYDIYAGQHIVNDGAVTGEDHITFNRKCSANLTFYCIWRKKTTTTQNKQIDIRKNGSLVGAIFLNSGSKREGTAIQFTLPLNFNEGDTLSFYFPDANKFQCASVIVKIEYSNYNIDSGDYGESLRYVYRRPVLDYYDGTTHTNYSAIGNTITIGTDTMIMPKLAFSYFGYWTNVPNIKIGDLFYELQWLLGKKLQYDYNSITFGNANEDIIIEGEILSIYPNSAYVGQNNYVRYMNQTTGLVSTIDNKWLEEEKNIHQSIFEFAHNDIINQYHIGEENNYEFTEIDNPVIFNRINNLSILPTLKTLGTEYLTQSNEVKIQLYNFHPNIDIADIIYINGREMFVIEGERDNNMITLTCIPIYK